MWLCFLLLVRTTGIMCEITDVLTPQVIVHWRRAFPEAIWTGELLCDQILQILTILQRHI